MLKNICFIVRRYVLIVHVEGSGKLLHCIYHRRDRTFFLRDTVIWFVSFSPSGHSPKTSKMA